VGEKEMSAEFPTFAEVGEYNIRERYGSIARLKDMSEREDDKE
jgi:hypothetical protein